MKNRNTRVAIIGTGNVGATCAYGLLMNAVANEIVLIDANRDRAEGEAMDLEHALPFMLPTKISVASLADCTECDAVLITAGAGRKPGESRLDLVRKNASMLRGMIPELLRTNPKAIFVIASNPVDILTYVMVRESGLPAHQVIGTGTILDTARFRSLLSQYFDVDPRSVHGYIIGEHGDTEVPVWSSANIAGMSLPKFCVNCGKTYDAAALEEVFLRTRDAGAAVIKRKSSTCYAIGTALVNLVSSILRDQNTVLTVSSLVEGYYGIRDVCLSLPTVVNRSGVREVLRLDLQPDEIQLLQRSAEVLKSTIAELDGQRQ